MPMKELFCDAIQFYVCAGFFLFLSLFLFRLSGVRFENPKDPRSNCFLYSLKPMRIYSELAETALPLSWYRQPSFRLNSRNRLIGVTRMIPLFATIKLSCSALPCS